MEEYIKYFETHEEYEEYRESGEMLRPNVSYCEDVKDVHYNPYVHDYSQDYLTTVALEDGTILFTPIESNIISYSIDGGNTWTEGNSVNVENGAEVLWKGTMTPQRYQGIGTFSSTCNFDVQGNVMSLIYGDDFKNQLSLEGKECCFFNLFKGATHLISAENLSLLATTLEFCCYTSMFEDCTSLTTAPQLLATTLADNCYQVMFKGCTSLTTAPQLLATTLASYCYDGMFEGCTSLTTAPQLFATILKIHCYAGMFDGCTNINYIKAMFTTTPSDTYTSNWVNGVAANGTFVKNSIATWDVSGIDGIPEGWTVETA